MLARSFYLPVLIAAGMWLAPRSARCESAADLLEKAIFAEETKGDLDGAIVLYKKVIDDAKAARTAAAKAQFRLANCYAKQGKKEAAIVAFQKLVDEFPDEKELVAQARQQLPSDLALEAVPWKDGDLLELNMKLATGLEIGRMFLSAHEKQVDGRPAWRLRSQAIVAIAGMQSSSEVVVDAETFRPITSRWKHTLLGDVSAAYTKDQVSLKAVGKDEPRVVKYDTLPYDNEECLHLIRRLPLAVGYKTKLPVYSTLGSGNVPVGLEVTAKEPVQTPAGKFDCFRVELSIQQTFWYSADEHRYLVKFEAGGAIAELIRANHLPADAKTELKDDAAGLSFTVPGEWRAFQLNKPDGKTNTAMVLDPWAIGLTQVEYSAIDQLDAKYRTSPEAWMKADVEELKTIAKEFALRGDVQPPQKIGERPAIGFAAGFVEGANRKVTYNLYVFGETSAAKFTTMVSADDFEQFRKDYEGFAETCRLK